MLTNRPEAVFFEL